MALAAALRYFLSPSVAAGKIQEMFALRQFRFP